MFHGSGMSGFKICALPLDAHAFLGDQDLIADAKAVGFGEQAFDRFIVRFVA
jgi:hypothetical protein